MTIIKVGFYQKCRKWDQEKAIVPHICNVDTICYLWHKSHTDWP